MTIAGWEFWGLKFDWLLVVLVSGILFLTVWFGTHKSVNMIHVDQMAGDEGED
ncbi:MAG TPA: hypothetical protein VIU40_10610 [Geobacteraceae bacterium]